MQAIPELIVLAAFNENDEGELLPAFEPREVDNKLKAKITPRRSPICTPASSPGRAAPISSTANSATLR